MRIQRQRARGAAPGRSIAVGKVGRKSPQPPPHLNRLTTLSSALRKFDLSRGPNALGPPVVCPVERRWSIKLRVASAMPIELSLKRFPFGAMTSAPDFTDATLIGAPGFAFSWPVCGNSDHLADSLAKLDIAPLRGFGFRLTE